MKSLKVVTIGDAGTGKTALTMRYTTNTFTYHDMTIGVDFAIKRFADGGKIQIWDTAGQESFRSISRSYYRGAHGAILVFSLNNLNSFQQIKMWYNDLKSINNNVFCVLVGTKSDLLHKINENDIDNMCKELNIKYFESSAKLNLNCNGPFEYIYANVTNNDNDSISVQSKYNPENTSKCIKCT
jgi:small GTP-binding protein